MPFFYVAGNHDYSNPAMARKWVRRFGTSYYHFRYRDVLFLVLNSELFASVHDPSQPVRGPETLEEQLRYAERVLDGHADARWTVVVLHQPLWDRSQVHPDWERFEALLGERDYSVYAGHYHAYTRHVRRERSYVTLATSGGVSRLRGIDRGEFDHLAVVTMTDRGPVMANLLLEGIHPEDLRTEATRRLVHKLDRVVHVEPLRAPSERFERGVQRLRLENPTDRPLVVRAHFEPGAGVWATPESLRRELEPGASEVVEVEVAAVPARLTAELAPLLARFEVEAPAEAGPPVRVARQGWLIPDRAYPVVPARGPVALDADLEEWGPLRFSLSGWPRAEGGRSEASLRFDFSQGADALYLAFRVPRLQPGCRIPTSPPSARTVCASAWTRGRIPSARAIAPSPGCWRTGTSSRSCWAGSRPAAPRRSASRSRRCPTAWRSSPPPPRRATPARWWCPSPSSTSAPGAPGRASASTSCSRTIGPGSTRRTSTPGARPATAVTPCPSREPAASSAHASPRRPTTIA